MAVLQKRGCYFAVDAACSERREMLPEQEVKGAQKAGDKWSQAV